MNEAQSRVDPITFWLLSVIETQPSTIYNTKLCSHLLFLPFPSQNRSDSQLRALEGWLLLEGRVVRHCPRAPSVSPPPQPGSPPTPASSSSPLSSFTRAIGVAGLPYALPKLEATSKASPSSIFACPPLRGPRLVLLVHTAPASCQPPETCRPEESTAFVLLEHKSGRSSAGPTDAVV